MRAIFCGNLEYDSRQSEVDRLFRRYGRVERVDMKSGFAFVYMEDERDADDAIRKLDRVEFGRKGRRLRVEWTKQERDNRRSGGSKKPAANEKPSKTLFVINFDPIYTKDKDLERHFDVHGKIANIRIRRNFAFIQFETQEEATRALEATNMSKLMDRVISVEYAIRDDDRTNGHSPDRRGRDRDLSPDRGGYRRRSPSPHRRERGSPDYGYRRDRGSPDYGRNRGSPDHGRKRGSPDQGRIRDSPDRGRSRDSPLHGRNRGSPDHGRIRDSPDRGRIRDSPDRGRNRGSPLHGRNRDSPDRGRNRGSPLHGRNRGSPLHGRKRDSPNHGRKRDSPNHGRKRDSPNHGRKRDSPNHGRKRDSPDHGCNRDSPEHVRNGDSPEHVRNGDSPDHVCNGDTPEYVRGSSPSSKPVAKGSPYGGDESPANGRYHSRSPPARERSRS